MQRRGFLAGAVAATVVSDQVLAAAVKSRGQPAVAFSARATGRALAVGVKGPSPLTYQATPARLTGVALGDPLDARQGRPTSDMTTLTQTWRANVVRLSVLPALYRDRRADELRYLDRDLKAAL